MENVSSSEQQQKKGNVLINYFKNSIAELRKVTWPTRQETWRKAWVVIAFSAVFAVFLGLIDYLMTTLIQIIL